MGMQEELTYQDILGHPDFRLLRDMQRGIVDLKCATAIRPSYWTQVAAYSWLWSPEAQIDFLGILRLDKITGDYEYKELSDPTEILYERDVWMSYLSLYRHRQRVAERSRIESEQEAYDASLP